MVVARGGDAGAGPLVIFGAGGLGRKVCELVQDVVDDGAGWELLGFLDDNPDLCDTTVHGLPVLGGAEWVRDHSGVGVVVGVANPVAKYRLTARLRDLGATFPRIVHGTATIGRQVVLGEGVVASAGAVVVTDAVIGPFVLLNSTVTVGEDTTIGAYATISPGAHIAGNVRIGTGCDIGTGATVIQGVDVGDWTIVGANAAVIRDLLPHTTAVGIPARVIKTREAAVPDAPQDPISTAGPT